MTGLHHRFDGPDGAPVLVLGPSLGTSTGLWEPQMAALARSRRVLRYDLPGHGASPPRTGRSVGVGWSGGTGRSVGVGWSGETGFTLDDLAAELDGLLDSHGIASADYAGVSMGAAIGATWALAAPGRIRRLVLCCTAARFGEPDGWHDRAAAVRERGTGPIADTAAQRWFTPDFPDPEPYVAMLRGADAASYAACCEALASYDLTARLPEIAAPTLVVAGADDPATPPGAGRVLAGGIPGARMVVVPGAAHLANVERPGAVTEAILTHLEDA